VEDEKIIRFVLEIIYKIGAKVDMSRQPPMIGRLLEIKVPVNQGRIATHLPKR
jgi:hypothetical protein